MAASNLKVKLLVDKKAQRVLFAEAGKEVVDFLFNLLALPVGTVVKLLSKESMPAASTPDKPTVYFYNCGVYGCGQNYVTGDRGTPCPGCRNQLSTQMTYVAGAAGTAAEQRRVDCGAGYVKGLVTYMIMDDLSVTPFSTISGITLLNNFNVREVGSLEEKVFDLDMDLGLAILKASLQSETVLTDVFLGSKKLK
ncbi:uncharacterized protein LOC122650986 [Telopea speciosissima]|uniref:uncharacterized protein LOC122650986 n=1 Tax=Telopea speciosissima TaxID=54955 RepID=UPI001CC59729|nr:uncharacterized protein LOC122650986 [Telopea speciosissima]